MQTRSKTYAERWVHELPLRWARNGAIFGLIFQYGTYGGWQHWARIATDPRLLAKVLGAILLLMVMFGVLFLVAGWLARWSLKNVVPLGGDELLRQIRRRWIVGALFFVALLLLSDIAFQWRGDPHVYGNGAEDIGYIAGSLIIAALIGFLVALVSRRGLKKALEIDAAIASAGKSNSVLSSSVMPSPAGSA